MLLVLLGFTLSAFSMAAPAPSRHQPAARPAPASAPAASQNDVLLQSLTSELDRAFTGLKKTDLPPYFISYSVHDGDTYSIAASEGALLTSFKIHERTADVSVRVGSPKLDNTHGRSRPSAISTVELPVEDDAPAIRRQLWRITDDEYVKARNAFTSAQGENEVRAKEEDDSPDFSVAPPHVDIVPPPPPLTINVSEMQSKLRDYSGVFRSHPEVIFSMVALQAEQARDYFVSTEGTQVVFPEKTIRIVAIAVARADDGMDLMRAETFDADSIATLPTGAAIKAKLESMASDLKKLRVAPIVEPYDGPAILSGRAAAVYFHEVLGHRLEGQRQRGDDEGQTFAKQVGQKILPDFLSVVDDPTMNTFHGTTLIGYYPFDSEGEPAQKVQLIKDGVLESFLMSRMPVNGVTSTNGHGRSSPSLMPVARQGNLIVTSTKTIKDADMRQALIDEIKRQHKPFGLYFEDISGGFTLTQRSLPQAFQVNPVMVWKIYPDGRPDELVRGVDIVGTPLAALNRIELTGDKPAVFDGECGAESGSIPVSAVAPSMLISEIEVAKQQQSHERPPILPPPSANPAQGGGR